MARPPHFYEPGMTYLITAVTYRRLPVFETPALAQVAFDDFIFYANKFQAQTFAAVVMPDHIHWVLQPDADDFVRFEQDQRNRRGKYADNPYRYYLSKIMEDYQRHCAFAVNQIRQYQGVKVWQDGFRDDALRSYKAVMAAIQYVVNNPVKAGLTTAPEDYPYLVWQAPA